MRLAVPVKFAFIAILPGPIVVGDSPAGLGDNDIAAYR